MTRRWRTAAAALAVVAAGLIALMVLRPEPERPSAPFCDLYPNIAKMTAMLERGLEGEALPGDLPPANYLTTAKLVWTDRVASGGPDDLDADAMRIAGAVRTAAETHDAAPLQTSEVRRAVGRVEAGAREACADGDR